MASPFNIKRTTQVGRNGFDMSQRHLFNAVPGMLIPVMVEETLPGDSHRINLDSFTRMRNLNTAAFARFKEYYDFYWVSMDTLWPYFNQVVINNNEPTPTPDGAGVAPVHLPHCSLKDLDSLILSYNGLSSDYRLDSMGINRYEGYRLLADMLGYGFPDENGSPSTEVTTDIKVNLLPWCAYQRIYADFYRNPQWERRDTSSYNLLAFYQQNNFISRSVLDGFNSMFMMRYANWHKDYFMGLYPTQQFGDVSVVSLNFTYGESAGSVSPFQANVLGVSTSGFSGGTGKFLAIGRSGSQNATYGDLSFDIHVLRRAQALQRWKEVTMTNGSSMYQQVKAHFGFDLPEGRKDAPEYLGGFDNVVSINDVDGTAAGSVGEGTDQVTSFLGQVGGKGLGVSDPRKTIEFTSKDFGLLMCIYHVEPLLDYANVGVKKFNTKLVAGDFYMPEFDKIGFGRVEPYELYLNIQKVYPWNDYSPLGYTSRYLDYKSSYDRVHGSFIPGRDTNKNDGAWVVSLTEEMLRSWIAVESGTGQTPLDYRFFKVDPRIANSIMVTEISPEGENLFGASPFMVAANFTYYKSSNMSVDSLPN